MTLSVFLLKSFIKYIDKIKYFSKNVSEEVIYKTKKKTLAFYNTKSMLINKFE